MSQTTTFGVDGMTCGHCVQHVTTELQAIPGVTDVAIDLVVGGSSQVRVTSDAALPDEAVSAAVDEAGYALTPRRSLL
ncbi:heavy-metal-associated domain-containing protein [Cellulomonas composti]|nr:heavy-metal-associated domain-containing protein [Cellulomonas composti]